MHRLSISHLESVQAIKNCDGNLTQAAGMLNVSPSALSHRLKELESRLKCAIFDKKGKKIVLTKAGEILYARSEKILDQLDTAQIDLTRISRGVKKIIRITSNSYHCFHWFSDFLVEFNRKYPDVDVEISAKCAENPILAAKEDKVDLAILPTQRKHSALRSYTIYTDELVAIVSKDNPLASKQYLKPEDFNNTAIVTNTSVAEEGREYDLFFRNNNIKMKRLISVGFTDVVADVVRKNMGIAVMMRNAAMRYAEDPGLKFIQITSEGIFADWRCFTRIASSDSEEISMIVDWLKANFGRDQA